MGIRSCVGSCRSRSWPRRSGQRLKRPAQPFGGHIGLTAKESTPDFPKEIKAPKGAPDILVIMTDDVGFGASTTFGGAVPTPTMDRLAQAGLRYAQFHIVALRSPTRAALLTGRNHHSVATGVVMELGTGYPGYNSLMSKSNGKFAEIRLADTKLTAEDEEQIRRARVAIDIWK